MSDTSDNPASSSPIDKPGMKVEGKGEPEVKGGPDEFFHLTPTERIFVATSRLQSLEVHLLELIRLDEQTRSLQAAPFLKQIPKHTRALDELLDTIRAFQALQVCRIWDRVDPAGFSLPTVGALLSSEEVLSILRADLEEKLLDKVVDYGPPRFKMAAELTSGLAKAVKAVANHDQSEQMKRLRNWRDRRLAHPIYRTRAERNGPIEKLRWADVTASLDVAGISIIAITRALRPDPKGGIDWEQTRAGTRDQCNAFFHSLSFTPPGKASS
jgi:hypothetical protein